MPRAVGEFQIVQDREAKLPVDSLSENRSSRLPGFRKLLRTRPDLSARSRCAPDLDQLAKDREALIPARDTAPARLGPASQPASHRSAGNKCFSKGSCSYLRPSVSTRAFLADVFPASPR